MATLPSYVTVTASGLSEALSRDVLRVEMDGGLAKQRPRYSRTLSTMKATLMIDGKANREAFDAWWGAEIGGGSAWFGFKDDTRGVVRNVRIVNGAIEWQLLGKGLWVATVELEGLV